MTLPLCYEPKYGYQYQIIGRYKNGPYDHIDYVVDLKELREQLKECRLSSGSIGYTYKFIELPKKYWPDSNSFKEIVK